MSHSNNRFNNRIWTNESVYRDSPIGNLERIMVSGISPLQQGFYGNIHACLSIRVHYNSAFLAPEQGVVATVMPLPNSTAVGTELGCMPRINDIQCNILVKAPLFEVPLEGKERNTHDLPIKSFAFWTESLEVLDGNVRIISQSHFSNVPNNFSYSVLDEIMLISFSPLQCLICIGTSSIGITLKNGLPFRQLLPSLPDVLPEVVLMQNLASRRDYRNSKALAVHIDSKDILLQRQSDFVFGKIGDNLEVGSQSVSLARPTIIQKGFVPLPVAILDKRNCNSVSRIDSQFHKIKGFGGEGLAVPGDIEFDRYAFGLPLASPNSTFQTSINLNIESSSYFGFGESLPMEIHESIAEISVTPQPIEFSSCLQGKIFENFALLGSNITYLQKDSTFHTTNRIYKFANIYNTYDVRQSIPPLKHVGFLVEDR